MQTGVSSCALTTSLTELRPLQTEYKHTHTHTPDTQAPQDTAAQSTRRQGYGTKASSLVNQNVEGRAFRKLQRAACKNKVNRRPQHQNSKNGLAHRITPPGARASVGRKHMRPSLPTSAQVLRQDGIQADVRAPKTAANGQGEGRALPPPQRAWVTSGSSCTSRWTTWGTGSVSAALPSCRPGLTGSAVGASGTGDLGPRTSHAR